MTRSMLSLAIMALLLGSGIADAQTAPSKKLYRWVDKNGKVQFSDTLPPEAVDQARTEINSESGMATASLDRALTPEERAAQEKLRAEHAAAEMAAEQQRKTEEAMLSSFRTEDDLKKSYAERASMLQQNLDAIEAGIGSQRASLASLLAEAAEAELAGRPVNHKQATSIVELHTEMTKQQQMLVLKQGELVELDHKLAVLVERFRELKKAKPGQAGAAEATPEPSPPTG